MADRIDVNSLVIEAGVIGFGVISFPYAATLGVSCMAFGALGIGLEISKPISRIMKCTGEYKNEIRKIMNIINVNEIKNNNGQYLKVDKVYPTVYGLDIEFEIPLGLSYKDIEKMLPSISSAIGGKKISQDFNKISIKFTELEKEYNLFFPPIPSKEKNKLKTYIGNNLEGIIDLDLSQAGGILIAGQTGSGKSTILRYILTHIAMNYNENQINMNLIDLKYSELTLFKDLKITKGHTTNIDEVGTYLEKFWKEIQRRFKLFEAIGSDCTDAYQYESITGKKLPINLMVIEEFALMSGKKFNNEVELLNKILCQCRASKSHVIITTQRPDAKTLDPRLKANITHTIGLKTKSIINSQIICDEDVLRYLRGNGHGYVFDNKGEREFQGFYLKPEQAIDMLKPYKAEPVIGKEDKDIISVNEFDLIEGDEF